MKFLIKKKEVKLVGYIYKLKFNKFGNIYDNRCTFFFRAPEPTL